MNRSFWGIQKWVAAGAMVVALVLGLSGLGTPSTSNVAGAAPSAGGMHFSLPVALSGSNNNGVRRESIPPSDGPAPRTGPPSPFRPLDLPNFGANVRANTDTQSPNRAQQEPSIAVNPTNPLNVVAAAKDERAGTNTKQTWIYTSTDGGQTWLNQIFHFAISSPYSSDPVVNFSDDGECYVTSLPYGGGSGDGVQVARSTDGGITFATGVHLPGTDGGSDKEWTWVDNNPSSPYYHRIYTAFMNFSPGFRVAYSSDRAQTWTLSPLSQSAYQFPMPISYPNGQVQVIYANPSTISHVRSTDGGQTWTGAQNISNYVYANCPPDNSGCGIWRLNTIPVIAVNSNNSKAVVVWADGSGGVSTIKYSVGTSNGTVWSPSQVLAPPGVSGTYQVEPWVAVDEGGIFHAIWYDDRANPNTSIFNIYYSQSTDDGQTWSQAGIISTATSDLRIGIPSSYNRAAGDYINVAATTNNVYAVWTDTRSGTGEDIYVVRGTSGGTPTATATGTPPTATPTNTPTITPTITPTPCTSGAVTNGGFETGSFAPWVILGVQPPPTVSNAVAHSGTYSALLGTVSGGEPTGDSSIYQTITVPASGGTLSYWYYPQTSDSITFDWQDAYVTDTSGTILATIMHVCEGTAAWTNQTFNMAPYAGQTVRIEFLVHQDGFGDDTSMYVDDVAMLASCGSTTPIPTNTTVPTNTAVATNTTVATNTAVATNTPGGATDTPTATNTAVPTDTVTGTPPTATETPTACTLSFEDVPVGSTFYPYVHCLACLGIINGYPCGGAGEPCNTNHDPYFRPTSNVTRGQFAKIASNSAGFQDPAGAQQYEDVAVGSIFFDFIWRLANRGYINGYPCGGPGEPCGSGNLPYFRPNANVTRGQLSKIDANAAGLTQTPGAQQYEDVLPGSTFYDYIWRLSDLGIMQGYPCGGPGEPCGPNNLPYFRPGANATRGQASKIVSNTFFPNCQSLRR